MAGIDFNQHFQHWYTVKWNKNVMHLKIYLQSIRSFSFWCFGVHYVKQQSNKAIKSKEY